ncbi:MAG: Hpt domain-containing protein [Paracoccaceae bacterium]
MSDPMQEIMASFFVECEELLEALLDALQLMADGESDVETINVAFRSVHSIKGGAGAFGLDELVSFAHQFETVMDRCRDGSLEIDAKLIDLFFRCSDMLSDLVRCSRDGEDIDDVATGKLIADLAVYAAPPETPKTKTQSIFNRWCLIWMTWEVAMDRGCPTSACPTLICLIWMLRPTSTCPTSTRR